MSVINLLSSKIYNRIAAGEVVERPYSVVKELVENSIDAGAKHITVEILGGGISAIRVFDDGCGIEKSQLKKAILPHATSKISKISDLDEIMTLGFRGEALASIASVSKMTITSKPKEQENGATLSCDGGEDGEVSDCASPDGTEIIVKNLFYNTPAREKFLKTERGEEGDVTNIVSKFILGNPEIAFTYVADGKTIFQSFGDGAESAMITVYGNDVIKNCFYIDGEKNGVKITGYIGKQNYYKANRTYQSVFINGRYIINQTVSSAVSNAYVSYLMKRQYPFYVIYLTLPPETVDVNVHPNKTDVRFSDNRIVYGSVYSVVSKVLDGMGEALEIVVDNQEKTNDFNEDCTTHNIEKSEFAARKISRSDAFNKESFKFDKFVFCDSGSKSLSETESLSKNISECEKDSVADIFAENKAYIEKLERLKKEKTENVTQQAIKIERELKYAGRVLNTYLIFDDGLDMYLVDQHAAHERMLFDSFNQKLKSGAVEVQPLLVPYVQSVNNVEYDFLMRNAKLFETMGIELSDFGGNCIKISAVPACLLDMDIGAFMSELLTGVEGYASVTVEGILKEKIAQKACKSAIKSGDEVSLSDVEIIAEKIKENPGLKCPHGRPVAIKITRTEIDKWFKRIL